MKRSDVVSLIANWAKPEIFQDVYNGNVEEWADNLLYTLEHEVGIIKPRPYVAVIATGAVFNPRIDFAKDTFINNEWEPEDETK